MLRMSRALSLNQGSLVLSSDSMRSPISFLQGEYLLIEETLPVVAQPQAGIDGRNLNLITFGVETCIVIVLAAETMVKGQRKRRTAALHADMVPKHYRDESPYGRFNRETFRKMVEYVSFNSTAKCQNITATIVGGQKDACFGLFSTANVRDNFAQYLIENGVRREKIHIGECHQVVCLFGGDTSNVHIAISSQDSNATIATELRKVAGTDAVLQHINNSIEEELNQGLRLSYRANTVFVHRASSNPGMIVARYAEINLNITTVSALQAKVTFEISPNLM